MRLTRRDILRGLLALPVAATVDWEQLLWVPKPQIVVPASLAEIHAATLNKMLPGIVDAFFKVDPLLKYFMEKSRVKLRGASIEPPFIFKAVP